MFSQTIDVRIPGGEAFAASTLAQMARGMSGNTAVHARFLRAPTGVWTVITIVEN